MIQITAHVGKNKQKQQQQKKEWFKMPFLHSVRNCKVHRGVTCTREKYFLSGRGGQISKPKTKIQALLLLAMILLS